MDYSSLQSETPKTGYNYTWIIIVIVIIFVVIGIILLVVFLRSGIKKDLTLTNVIFSTVGSDNIECTWTGSGDKNNVVVLYAVPSTDTMKFDRSGNPLGSYANSGDPNPSVSGSMPTTTMSNLNTVSITSGLTSGVNYISILVVTNPNIRIESNSYASKVLHVSSNLVPGVFNISSTGQPGNIIWAKNTDKDLIVGYEQNVFTIGNNRFHHDPDGLLCTVSSITSLFTIDSKCPETSNVLYSTSGGDLGIAPLEINNDSNTILNDNNNRWIYTGKQWCLKNNTSLCMTYNPTSDKKNTLLSLEPDSPVISHKSTSTKIRTITMGPQGSNGTNWTNTKVQPVIIE